MVSRVPSPPPLPGPLPGLGKVEGGEKKRKCGKEGRAGPGASPSLFLFHSLPSVPFPVEREEACSQVREGSIWYTASGGLGQSAKLVREGNLRVAKPYTIARKLCPLSDRP